MLRLTLVAAVFAAIFALSPFTNFVRIDSSAAIPVFHR
jgi:hypothetical protein